MGILSGKQSIGKLHSRSGFTVCPFKSLPKQHLVIKQHQWLPIWVSVVSKSSGICCSCEDIGVLKEI